MASKVSSTSNLPWTWAIEALSCSNKVDTSLLIDIVKSAPEISDDLEKHVREMVTLRILEGLSMEENQIMNNDSPAECQKVELDPLNSAEDVLRRILEEMSATDPKIVGSEVQNWDVRSFIVHKQTSFTIRALQKLKEAILEGGHSVLETLKERSGLTVRTQCDNNTSVNLGNSNCLTQRLGESSREISENGDAESEDNLSDRRLVPADTTTAATFGENLGTQCCEDQINLDDGSMEKFKQDSNITDGTVVQNSIGSLSHWRSTNASDAIVQYIGRDRILLQKEVKVGCSTPQKRDGRLEESFETINLLPTEKNRVAATADDLDKLSYDSKSTLGDGHDSSAEASKKIKQGADFIRQNRVENQIASPLYGQPTNASKEIPRCTEREAHKLHLEVKVGSSTPQNSDGELQGTVLDRNLLPSKRNRVIVTAEKSGDGFDAHAEAAKKLKPDTNVAGDDLVENPISSPMHKVTTISCDMIIEEIHTGKCNLEKEAPPGAIECIESLHDTECQNAALNRLSQSRDADDHVPRTLEVEVNDNKIAELSTVSTGQKNGLDGGNGHRGHLEPKTLYSKSSAGMEKEICPANASNGFEGNFPRNASKGGKAKDDMVCSPDLEMTSDSDENDDDRIDAALKKDALLCSQYSYSQDSYMTQSNSCIKCNGDGELLFCSSETCQLMVHKSCLRSAGTFDENGKFYCPFCAYSRSISEYLQVKRKASLARKDLAMFIGVKTDCQPKKSTLRSDGAKQSQLNRNGEFALNNEGNADENLMNKASKSHCRDNMENRNQKQLPKSCYVDNRLCGERMLTDGTAHGSAKSNLERLDMGQELQSPGGNLEQLRASELVKKSSNVGRNSNSIDGNEKNREVHAEKIRDNPKSTLPLETLRRSNTESAEEDNVKLATSRYSRRLRTPVMQYTDPANPPLRRKALPWSKAEEEKLKEGVQRLSSVQHKTIPWSMILKSGVGVFHKGRTAGDLKDKWRNMCKVNLVWD